MFVDASAIVAMVTFESDADHLADILERAQFPITSPIAIFEAALGISRKHPTNVENAEALVRRFLDRTGVCIVPVSVEAGFEALSAQARFGRGRGHPAQLNMGDCFAYAVAKTHGVPLLFKGNDFPHTDITPAA